MKILIMLGLPAEFEEKYDFLVGVDRGAYYLAEQGIEMDLALGDFDSVAEKEFSLITVYAKDIQQLPAEKDITDSEFAVNYVQQFQPSEIVLYGGLGKRMDHTLVNLKLLEKYPLLVLKDRYNKVQLYSSGNYTLDKEGYTYLSLIPLSECLISLSGVKYPLYEKRIAANDSYLTSNEILESSAELIVEGRIFVLKTKD